MPSDFIFCRNLKLGSAKSVPPMFGAAARRNSNIYLLLMRQEDSAMDVKSSSSRICRVDSNKVQWSAYLADCVETFIWVAKLNDVMYSFPILATIGQHQQKTLPSGQNGSSTAVRDIPVADYSAPRTNNTCGLVYHPPIAVLVFHLALSVYICK
jgi:hypothetical protein